jgi:hypothetical protein
MIFLAASLNRSCLLNEIDKPLKRLGIYAMNCRDNAGLARETGGIRSDQAFDITAISP